MSKNKKIDKRDLKIIEFQIKREDIILFDENR